MDTWVTNAVAAGLTPLLQVYYDPSGQTAVSRIPLLP